MEVSTNIYEHKYMSFDLKEDRIAFIRKVAPKIWMTMGFSMLFHDMYHM